MKSVYELRGGSGLANWLEFVLLTKRSALLQAGARVYEVVRVAPCLSKGRITPNEGRRMAKKAGNQIIDALEALPVNEIDNTCTITVEQRDAWIKLLTRVDKRDMQNRVARKKAPAKKAARR